jgi:type I site-specific restriction endonuclease
MVTAPVLTLVEAKDNEIRVGLGQCVAQMVAAQLFNTRNGREQPVVYGAVSTGTNWKFIMLENQLVKIDLTEYFITQLDQILGILAEPFRIYFEGAIA